MNNELIKEVNGKTYHFKFKSKRLVDLEKLTGKSIIELLQDTSFSNVALLLKYGCLDEIDEYELLDGLLEVMTFEKIILDILVETCAVSGIISKKDAKEIKEKKTDDLKN